MDPKTQVTSVHGISMLDGRPVAARGELALPLVHESPTANDRAMLNIAVAAEVNLYGDADAGRGRGRARGRQRAQHRDGRRGAPSSGRSASSGRACARALIDLFAHSGPAEHG